MRLSVRIRASKHFEHSRVAFGIVWKYCCKVNIYIYIFFYSKSRTWWLSCLSNESADESFSLKHITRLKKLFVVRIKPRDEATSVRWFPTVSGGRMDGWMECWIDGWGGGGWLMFRRLNGVQHHGQLLRGSRPIPELLTHCQVSFLWSGGARRQFIHWFIMSPLPEYGKFFEGYLSLVVPLAEESEMSACLKCIVLASRVSLSGWLKEE